MMNVEAFHSSRGGYDFLGLRNGRTGNMEIVYDDGAKKRMVWRVETPDVERKSVGEALSVAVNRLRVIPALYDELKKRSIQIETVEQ